MVWAQDGEPTYEAPPEHEHEHEHKHEHKHWPVRDRECVTHQNPEYEADPEA